MSRPSIIKRITGAVSAGPPASLSASEVAQRLSHARASLEALARDHAQAALDAVSGLNGSAERLVALGQNLRKARDEVATLEAAHGMAAAHEAEAARIAKQALRRSQKAAFRKQIEPRVAAAQKVREGIVLATQGYRELLNQNAAARSAYPGAELPKGALLEDARVHSAVENEIARAWTNPILGERLRFPGTSRPDVPYDPAAIPSLVEEIERANVYAIKTADELP